jgi:hypothetical protein
MKKILIICILAVLVFSSVGLSSANRNITQSLHRGSFNAEIGLRENIAKFNLDGNFRDFRGGHILLGTISPVDSERTLRFQGYSSRNLFIIQTGARNNIINIVGRFTDYDEINDEYSGQWQGFIVGMGRTSGWITASFS